MNKILILSALALLFVGCVTPQNHYRQAEMLGDQGIVYPYKAQMTGIIALTTKKRCNEAEYMFYARTKASAHKVINIVMNETCQTEGGTSIEDCSCEYSGIGIRYVPIDGDDFIVDAKVEDTTEEVPQRETKLKKVKIQLSSYPQGATISINGKVMNSRTPTEMNFRPGKYSILFSLDGYQRDTTFVVEENQPDQEIYMALQ